MGLWFCKAKELLSVWLESQRNMDALSVSSTCIWGYTRTTLHWHGGDALPTNVQWGIHPFCIVHVPPVEETFLATEMFSQYTVGMWYGRQGELRPAAELTRYPRLHLDIVESCWGTLFFTSLEYSRSIYIYASIFTGDMTRPGVSWIPAKPYSSPGYPVITPILL